jgi:hypothetical protein
VEGISDGEDAPERREELIEFWRLSDCAAGTRVRSAEEVSVVPEALLPATPPVVQDVVVLAAAPVVILRVLVLEEERWCIRCDGAG